MHKSAYLCLTFVVGVVVGCLIQSPLATHTAHAQPAAGKWEYKFFTVYNGSDARDPDPASTLKELNEDGRWEYTGFTHVTNARISFPLFKRPRK